MDVSCLIPFQAVVLDKRRGDGYGLAQVGDATHRTAARLVEKLNPVILGHAIGNDLVQAIGQLLPGKRYILAQLHHLLGERVKLRTALACHRVGTAHGRLEALERPGKSVHHVTKLADRAYRRVKDEALLCHLTEMVARGDGRSANLVKDLVKTFRFHGQLLEHATIVALDLDLKFYCLCHVSLF